MWRCRACPKEPPSAVVTDNPFRNAVRFLAVLTLDRYQKDSLDRVWKLLQRNKTHAGANPRVGAHGGRKADAIQAVIDAHPAAASDLERLFHEMTPQGQSVALGGRRII